MKLLAASASGAGAAGPPERPARAHPVHGRAGLATLGGAALCLFGVCALVLSGPGMAADLGYAPRPYLVPQPPAPPPYAFAVDPRCSIVPMPQADLVGDTARFRATAVCQSRGLYADSLIFPGPPVLYRGYHYGREP
ncbi:hypothetical protein Msil_3291 [Methylocella silvestris BL2]|uniref:Uncharacterized protein n=1 Tax=Methylocella silvestris (strain DSM 15510 / CIP 108128 / LMG 27833 / NCIMB 13906 / BL2) TaxID=395965 RepID=B8EQI5_METSB|nr:hypothetical protein [Methylocella silvestris]ACK52198.1 hypothetical protein Msil_3291 [Methylocella silvestris BL2]